MTALISKSGMLLYAALNSVFTTKSEIDIFLSDAIGRGVDQVYLGDNTSDILFHAIARAEEEGWISDLFEATIEAEFCPDKEIKILQSAQSRLELIDRSKMSRRINEERKSRNDLNRTNKERITRHMLYGYDLKELINRFQNNLEDIEQETRGGIFTFVLSAPDRDMHDMMIYRIEKIVDRIMPRLEHTTRLFLDGHLNDDPNNAVTNAIQDHFKLSFQNIIKEKQSVIKEGENYSMVVTMDIHDPSYVPWQDVNQAAHNFSDTQKKNVGLEGEKNILYMQNIFILLFILDHARGDFDYSCTRYEPFCFPDFENDDLKMYLRTNFDMVDNVQIKKILGMPSTPAKFAVWNGLVNSLI